MLIFPKPCFCFQKSKIQDLYFISLRKTSKPDLSEGLKEFKEDKRNRYRLLVLWLFCSFRGWGGQDVLKSQKKGIFKTLSEDGFVNWRLSGLPSVCISSLFIWLYSHTSSSRIPAPVYTPKSQSRSSFVDFKQMFLSQKRGRETSGWSQRKMLP